MFVCMTFITNPLQFLAGECPFQQSLFRRIPRTHSIQWAWIEVSLLQHSSARTDELQSREGFHHVQRSLWSFVCTGLPPHSRTDMDFAIQSSQKHLSWRLQRSCKWMFMTTMRQLTAWTYIYMWCFVGETGKEGGREIVLLQRNKVSDRNCSGYSWTARHWRGHRLDQEKHSNQICLCAGIASWHVYLVRIPNQAALADPHRQGDLDGHPSHHGSGHSGNYSAKTTQ